MRKIIIPEQHFIGLVVRQDGMLPLGFLTPYGTDAAAKKRISTVNQWAGKRGIKPAILDNKAMHGFRLTASIRTGDYGAEDKWRIEDPRGFELEISSANLAELMSNSTIENGEILQPCIWARESGNNVLVNIESEEYQEAVQMTNVAVSSANWKDCKPGYKIQLQNGLSGIYLGKVYGLVRTTGGSTGNKSQLNVANPQYVFKIDDGKSTVLQWLSSPKLSSYTPDTVLTDDEVETIINNGILQKDIHIYRNAYDTICAVSTSKIKDWCITRVPTPDAFEPWGADCADKRYVLVETTDGKVGEKRYSWSGNPPVINLLESDKLANKEICYKITPSKGWWGVRSPNIDSLTLDPAQIAKTEFIQLNITTDKNTTISQIMAR